MENFLKKWETASLITSIRNKQELTVSEIPVNHFRLIKKLKRPNKEYFKYTLYFGSTRKFKGLELNFADFRIIENQVYFTFLSEKSINSVKVIHNHKKSTTSTSISIESKTIGEKITEIYKIKNSNQLIKYNEVHSEFFKIECIVDSNNQNDLPNKTPITSYKSINDFFIGKRISIKYKRFIYWFYERFGNQWVNPTDFDDEINKKLLEFRFKITVDKCFYNIKANSYMEFKKGKTNKSLYKLPIS